MAKISTYPVISIPTLNDLLIGTDVANLNDTKNFSLGDIATLIISGNYVPYIGANQDVFLGAFNISANSFINTNGTVSDFLKADGSLDSTVYQPAGNYITSLTGEATASGPGAATVTLSNSAVIGKVLTGLIVTGGSVSATDSILTAFGKVQNQINGLYGGAIYQGTWNASTNTPLIQSGIGIQGYYYIVSVAGSTSIDGISDWNVGDWIIFDGTAWQQVDNTDTVVSVNGQVGVVVLTTTNISEGTNLYFTDSRARLALSLTTTGNSGASTYNNATGAFNIPDYTASGLGAVPTSRQLSINGTSYDLSADRSWSVGTVTSVGTSAPLTGGTITGSGTIGITQSGVSTDGYLSSTDWNTFNNKQNALTNPVTGTGTIYFLPMWSGASSLTDSILSYSLNIVTFNYNSASGGTINYTNTNGTPYTYTIQMNNATAPRQTYHSYTDGNILQQINSVVVSKNLQSGQLVLPLYTATSSFTGTAIGVLGFDSLGNILTTAATTDTNIYNADGTLTSARTLTSGGFNLTFTGSNTAASAIARGLYLTPTLIASANSDVLVGLDIAPTFTLGAFTGTASIALRILNGAFHLGGSIAGRLTYEQFHVKESDATLALQATSASSYSGVNMFDSSDALAASFQYGNASAAQFPNTFFLGPRNATGKLHIVRGTTPTISLTMFSNGNFLIQDGGTITDGGYRLDINGTVRFQDNTIVSKNQNAATSYTVSNTTSGTASQSQLILTSDATSGSANIGKKSNTFTTSGIINLADFAIVNNTKGDIAILNSFASGKVKFAAGGSTTAQMTLSSSGVLSIGTTSPNASAITQIDSTTQGFLPPRMTNAQRTAIATPATGLLAYATDATEGLYVKLSGGFQRFLTTADGTGTGTVTSVAALTLGTTGTDLSSTVATGTTTPVITLQVPTASATNRGALSSADWTSFNGKFTLPSLTSGSVLFSNGTTIAQDNANFFWDDTNNRLGIGTATPSYSLDINGTGRFQDDLLVSKGQNSTTSITVSNTTAGTISSAAFLSTSVNGTMSMGKVSSTYTPVGTVIQVNDAVINNNTNGDISIFNNVGTGRIKFASNAATTPQMTLSETGNLLVGTTTDSTYKFDLVGSQRITTTSTTLASLSLTNTSSVVNASTYGITSGTTVNVLAAASYTGSVVQTGVQGSLKLNFAGAATVSNANPLAGVIAIDTTNITTGTVTVTQGSAPNIIRAVSSIYAQLQFEAPSAGTLSHYANIWCASPNGTTGSLTVTNYYGILLQSTAASVNGITATTSWGVYQEGTADNNYLAGSLLVGTTTNSGYKLDVVGTARVSSSFTANSLIVTAATTGSVIFAAASGVISQDNANFFWDNTNKRLGIGTATPANPLQVNGAIRSTSLLASTSATIGGTSAANAAAVIDIISTTKGVLFPRMTTTQKNAIATPLAGLVVYDTTLNKLSVYTTAWQTITSV